ncbi:uncharacterized protein LOC135103601 [Scylla paramamosain]|uniref:uncharacterized protein LOC135103601 n=1 Tax=Scylla paramamosain TaxID=85552 RepID=UPI003083BD85
MAGRVSSLIIAGPSPWTVYRGENFTGMSLCMYPERSPAASLDGKLVFGIVHDIKRLDMPDNSIMSVKKGCDSRAASHKLIIEADGQNKDGAWRFFKHKA